MIRAMRSLRAPVLLALTLALIVPSSATRAAPVAFVPGPFVPGRGLAFWDAVHGLATDGRQIARTDDGGRTWHVVRRGKFGYRGVAVEGTRNAWALVDGVCDDVSCRHPGVIRSSDRGYHWYRVSGLPLWSLDFVTSNLGWAMLPRLSDAAPPLALTLDGGHTWHRLPRPCTSSSASWSELAPTFLPDGRGWILCKGQPGAGMEAQELRETVDGGRHWQIEIRWQRFTEAPMDGISIVADGSGWIWGPYDLEYTFDFGHTWHPPEGHLTTLVRQLSQPKPRLAYVITDEIGRYHFALSRLMGNPPAWRTVSRW